MVNFPSTVFQRFFLWFSIYWKWPGGCGSGWLLFVLFSALLLNSFLFFLLSSFHSLPLPSFLLCPCSLFLTTHSLSCNLSWLLFFEVPGFVTFRKFVNASVSFSWLSGPSLLKFWLFVLYISHNQFDNFATQLDFCPVLVFHFLFLALETSIDISLNPEVCFFPQLHPCY